LKKKKEILNEYIILPDFLMSLLPIFLKPPIKISMTDDKPWMHPIQKPIFKPFVGSD
jgi:hypothetical protein